MHGQMKEVSCRNKGPIGASIRVDGVAGIAVKSQVTRWGDGARFPEALSLFLRDRLQ